MKFLIYILVNLAFISMPLLSAGIYMPADYNPLVDNTKEAEVAQKKFKKICLNPSKSQLKTLKIIKKHTLCGIAPLPSEQGCNKMIACYISKYQRYSMYKFGVSNTELSDLSPVQFFTSSKNFDLNDNKIKDLSYLAKLTNITELNLSGNPVTNIVPLINLKNLLTLRLLNTPLTDLSPVAKIPSLSILTFGSNVSDISPLKFLKDLDSLYIRSKHSIDICHIKNLKNLDSLTIEGGNISNIDCLKDLTNLIFLRLENMPLKDLSVLKNFKKLKFLSLIDVPVESIDVVESLEKISVISLVNTSIKDLSVLVKMKNKGSNVFLDRVNFRGNLLLIRCSPKDYYEVEAGKSCYEKDGTLKSFWKRWLRL